MRRFALAALAVLAVTAIPASAAPAPARVACLTANGDVGRAKPANCVILGLGFGDAGYFAVKNMRWSGWGTSRASANGVIRTTSFEGEPVRARARVVLSDPRRGCNGRRWYTTVRVSVDGGRPLTMSLPNCSGPRD